MRYALTTMFSVGFALSALAQGQVGIFACEWKRIDIPRSVVRPPPTTEEAVIGLDVYYIGKKLGDLPFEDEALLKLVEKARSEDQSDVPYFGPGYEYIIKDSKDRCFIVFYEFKKGHKFLTGFRAAIAPLNDLGTKGAVFVGDPYAGATFDKTLLAALKALTEKQMAEQAGTSAGDKPSD